ncbi:MAG: class I SAM-dependent methyltransferase [Actinomycetota bacterium]|nr:class I SAM-dependent methyltransferase [Actinomycetota bacterium]
MSLHRGKVVSGQSSGVDDWMDMLNARLDECVATLDRERMGVEIVFRQRDGDDEYLYWVQVRGDGASVETSPAQLDLDHVAFDERCRERGWQLGEPELLLLPAAVRAAVLGHCDVDDTAEGRNDSPDGSGAPVARPDAESWLARGDRMHELYLPGRAELLVATTTMIRATCGPAPHVLDLAGGTGSTALRIVAALPGSTCTIADVDPALLALARDVTARRGLDDRITVVAADLTAGHWTEAVLGNGPFDAVVVVLALHWFEPARLAALLREIRSVLRPGGLFVNADRLPEARGSALRASFDPARAGHAEHLVAQGVETWDEWWTALRHDPSMRDLIAERDQLMSDAHRSAEHHPTVEWYHDSLLAAGFAASGTIWRRHDAAAVAAIA